MLTWRSVSKIKRKKEIIYYGAKYEWPCAHKRLRLFQILCFNEIRISWPFYSNRTKKVINNKFPNTDVGHQQTCIGLGCFAFSQEESSQWLCKMRKMVQKSDFVPEHSNFSTIPWVPVTQPCHNVFPGTLVNSCYDFLPFCRLSLHGINCFLCCTETF